MLIQRDKSYLNFYLMILLGSPEHISFCYIYQMLDINSCQRKCWITNLVIYFKHSLFFFLVIFLFIKIIILIKLNLESKKSGGKCCPIAIRDTVKLRHRAKPRKWRRWRQITWRHGLESRDWDPRVLSNSTTPSLYGPKQQRGEYSFISQFVPKKIHISKM